MSSRSVVVWLILITNPRSLRKFFLTGLTTGLLGVFPVGVMAEDILDIYELAQQHDRTYSAAKNQFEAIKQGQRQVKGLYYPTVELSYESLDTDQTINRSDNEVFGTGESNYPTDIFNVSLTQPLFRWDYRTERKRASAEVRQGEFELIAAEQQLMLRAAENYLLALAAQDTQVMAQAELDAVGEQLKLSEKRFEIGLANTGEVNESRARHQLNQAELIQTENAVSDRMHALAVIVGSVPASLTPLKEQFAMVAPQPADIDSWVTRAEQDNYVLQSGAAAVEVADAEYARHKADRYPDIDLFANVNNRDAQGSLFGGGSDVDTTDIGIRAQWTLFQGGRLRAKIREAMYNKQKAEDELGLAQANVRRETRSAYLGVVSSIARAAALKASLDAQDMSVQAKQKGFDTGTNSNLEVLDAKRDYFFVQRDYLKARYDYLLSMLNLKRLVGNLSPADLQRVNSVLVGGASVSSMSTGEPALIEDIGSSARLEETPTIEAEALIEAEAVGEDEVFEAIDADAFDPEVEAFEESVELLETEAGAMEEPVDIEFGAVATIAENVDTQDVLDTAQGDRQVGEGVMNSEGQSQELTDPEPSAAEAEVIEAIGAEVLEQQPQALVTDDKAIEAPIDLTDVETAMEAEVELVDQSTQILEVEAEVTEADASEDQAPVVDAGAEVIEESNDAVDEAAASEGEVEGIDQAQTFNGEAEAIEAPIDLTDVETAMEAEVELVDQSTQILEVEAEVTEADASEEQAPVVNAGAEVIEESNDAVDEAAASEGEVEGIDQAQTFNGEAEAIEAPIDLTDVETAMEAEVELVDQSTQMLEVEAEVTEADASEEQAPVVNAGAEVIETSNEAVVEAAAIVQNPAPVLEIEDEFVEEQVNAEAVNAEEIDETADVAEKAYPASIDSAANPDEQTAELSGEALEDEQLGESQASDVLPDAWLSSLPPYSYTLQLATVQGLERCSALGSKLGIEPVYCFEGRSVAGRYFALSGLYESRAAAMASAVEMGVPDAWVRYVPRVQATRCGIAELDGRYQKTCTDFTETPVVSSSANQPNWPVSEDELMAKDNIQEKVQPQLSEVALE